MALTQKQRSLLSLASLGLVASLAGVVAYLGIFKREEAEKQQKEQREKLFEFDKAKVKSLSVFAKGQTTELVKEGEVWKITSPIKTDADKVTVDSILDRVANLKHKAVIEAKPEDPGKYGLKNPAIRIVAAVEGGATIHLAGGEENEFDGSSYVQRGQDPAILHAEGALKWALEKDAFDLRDKRVLAFEDADVKRIEVKAPKIGYTLEKADKWKLLPPVSVLDAAAKKPNTWRTVALAPGLAEEATVNRVTAGLRNLRATKFVEESAPDLKNYGLDKPRAEAVLMVGAGNARRSVFIGQVDEGGTKKTWARRGEAGWVAEIGDTVIEDLDRPLLDLRDKTVLPFDRDKVAAVTFVAGGQSIQVEKKAVPDGGLEGDAWTISAPKQAEAKKWKMSNVLWTLQSLKASAFADEKPKDLAKFGLDKPSRSVTLLGADGKELGTIKFGNDVGANVYAVSTSDPRVVEVEKSRLSDVPSALADIEEPAPAVSDGGTGGASN